MPTAPVNGRVSNWYDELPASRGSLPGHRDADVCIVGAGYTGLWTAYYLKRADPSLRIAILEARFAGFGASGRNGGWLSGLVPGDRDRMAQQHGRDGVVAWQRALNDAVDEVIDVAAREGIDAGIVKGGTLQIARNPAQASRLTAEADEELSWKVDGIAVLSKAEAAERVRFAGVVAAYYNPHCARIQPAHLARGLADAVERLGVDIYEQTPVTAIEAGKATHAARHRHRADRAARDRGLHRPAAGAASALAADEQLDDRHRADIGDAVGQHRLATAARPSAMPHTASSTRSAPPTTASRSAAAACRTATRRAPTSTGGCPNATIAYLTGVLRGVLPQVRDVPIAHGWCGVLAVPRDWSAGVALDKATGMGWAGGYVGHGVTATNLAGRTLADLVLDRKTPLTELPWVGHQSPNWEPEPLRWLGVRSMYLAYKAADWHEARGRTSTSPIAVLADKIAGRP